MIDINEGKTNGYLVPGVIVILLGLFLLLMGIANLLFLIPGLATITFAIMLFNATSGLEIDVKNFRYRAYGQVGPKKSGEWKRMIEPQSIVLKMYTASDYRESAPVVGMVAGLATKTLTYDIQIKDSLDQIYSIYDFLKYSKAKKCLIEMEKAFKIPCKDLVREKMNANIRNRR